LKDKSAKCGAENVEEAIRLADSYLDILQGDTKDFKAFTAYRKSHPEEFMWMLKRKHERMERSKITTKVRPYYVPPLAVKLLYLWVAHYLQEALVPYTVSDTSNSAYKTSWFHRGGNAFIEGWMHRKVREAIEKKTSSFSAISFGDDNVWLFVWPDGTFVVLGPDVNAMDMHVPTPIGGLLYRSAELYYETQFRKGFPLLFGRVFRQLIHDAFVTNLHVCGPYNFLAMWSLRSGIPLTTLLDMMFSGVIQGLVKQVWEKVIAQQATYDKSSFETFISHVEKFVKGKTGATFKVGTLEPFVYSPDFSSNTEYKFSFLGVTFRKVDLGSEVLDSEGDILVSWVPIPLDLPKYYASMSLPNRRVADNPHVNYLERMYGLYLSGAWITDLGPLIEREYKAVLSLGIRPKQIDCISTGYEEIEDLFDSAIESTPELPSKAVILSMYGEAQESAVEKFERWIAQFDSVAAVHEEDLREAVTDFSFLSLNKTGGSVLADKKHVGSIKFPGPPKPARPPQPKKQSWKAKAKSGPTTLTVHIPDDDVEMSELYMIEEKSDEDDADFDDVYYDPEIETYKEPEDDGVYPEPEPDDGYMSGEDEDMEEGDHHVMFHVGGHQDDDDFTI
jgi:hypothetical protein